MKILITRPREQANGFAEELISAGHIPVFFPVIQIQPIAENKALLESLTNISFFDWVVFTSVNGVKVVIEMLDQLGLKGLPPKVQVAAIGPKTAEELKSFGIIPQFVPGDYIAEAIVPGMGDLTGRHVLLPRAEIARKTLAEAITAAGGIVHEVAVYQTLPAQPDAQGLLALRAGVDVVTLTSSSIVKNFVDITRAADLDPLQLPGNPIYACIGPITAQTARNARLPNLIVAERFTTDGLIQAIQSLNKR